MSGVSQFSYYTIQDGDTLSTIAEKFDVSVNSILWSNESARMKILKPGDTLRIPPVSGIVYNVEPNDTIDAIAVKYKIDKLDILAQNQLDASQELKIGQQLILPGAQKPEPPKPIFIAEKKAPNTPKSAAAPKALASAKGKK